MGTRKTLGEQLQARRELFGFTRNELATRAKVAPNMVVMIETGATKSPTVATMGKLAHALKCYLVVMDSRRVAFEERP